MSKKRVAIGVGEALEIELNGKVFSATRLVDLPMSRSREVAAANKALSEATTEEERSARLVEFFQVAIPEFTEHDYKNMTARQVGHLVQLLGEDLSPARKAPTSATTGG
jgi:hypothetical protein